MTRKTIKKHFHKWLAVFVAAAFLVTVQSSWWIQSSLARKWADDVLHNKLKDAKKQVLHTQENLDKILQLTSTAAISSAQTFARIVASDPTVLTDRERLEAVRRDLEVDELHVSDENGILICSIPKENEGFDMASTEQSKVFLDAIHNPDFALWQEPMPNGSRNVPMAYAGVARRDRPGIVQIGFNASVIENEKKIADVEHIASTFSIGENGTLRIIENTQPEATEEKTFYETVNGQKSLCLSAPCGTYTLIGSLPEKEIYSTRDSLLWILIIAYLLLFVVIFFQISFLLKRVVVTGFNDVNDSLEKITNGDLEEKVVVNHTTEFESLSQGINATVTALKTSIENEAQRLNAELEMGHKIQTSVLPPRKMENERVHLAANMFTAKEVGGDFYDFFMVGDHKIALLVADVAGKGLTAALYMMGAKAMLKGLILKKDNPAEAFNEANIELCHYNEANMFLTAFLAVLDLETGEAICVNAGHNPPLLRHEDGIWEYLRIKHSLVLGISEKIGYTNVPLQLAKGDRLFLYTDGVTEAKNAENKLLGEKNLQEMLNAMSGTPSELIEQIKGKIDAFSIGMPQSDDITMLVVDYLGATE